MCVVPLATKGNDIFIAFRGEQFPRMLQRRSFNLHVIIVSYRTFGALFFIFLLLSFFVLEMRRMKKCLLRTYNRDVYAR